MNPQDAFFHINGPVIFFTWKPSENWSVNYVSDNIQQLGYYSKDFISGVVNYSDLIHPDDFPKIRGELDLHLQFGSQSFEQEYRVRNKSGEYRWVVDRTLIPQSCAGSSEHAYGYVIDITERKVSDIQRNKAKDMYSQLFQRGKAIQLLIDPETQAIVDANAAAQTYYGYSIEELKSLSISDLNILPSEQTQIEMERAQLEERSFFNFQHKLKNGDIRDVAVVSGPFNANGKEILYSIINDVTAQKSAKRELERSEAMLRSFISTTTDGFITLDQSLNITHCNVPFCEMLSSAREKVLGRSVYSFLSSPDEIFISTLLRTLKNQKNWSVETVLKKESGELIYAQLSGGPIENGSGIFAFITDISIQKRSQMELKKLSLAVEHAGSSIMITNKQGVIEYVNPSFCNITGYLSSEVIGQTPSIVSTGHTTEQTHTDLWQTILSGSDWRGETYNRTKTGAFYWSFMSISPISDENGNITHFVSVSEDITEQKKAQNQLEKLALYDPLTGLANRRLFNDRLNQAAAICLRSTSSELALIMLDLDRFKLINDTLGHDAGDELLKIIAERLLLCVRKSDTVARIGGDEFTLLLQSVNGRDDAQKIAENILEVVSKPLLIGNQKLKVTCSLGISLFPLDGDNSEDVIKNADLALYRAKKEGRNRCMFFLEAYRDEALRQVALQTQ
ncbi:bifunctional diguanylate cyclase/phosphodiesterase [Neptunomonas japonica]|uniref:Signal transduction protein n=1 Tax=Neptunomonas japonica JAMM 1380 TaxID=1441457 RepID=A0A7R6SW56_9GAMM|nr:PAS domain S-box protein [Neptunomonas japonica]BBB29415.1 signal transduction protein [Neptunomonas japonica JAMM 1380]